MGDLQRSCSSPIERCPSEILLRILEYLSDKDITDWRDRAGDLLSLRLTSRRLSTFFTPHIVDNIDVECTIVWDQKQRLHRAETKIRPFDALIPTPTAFAQHIPFLSITLIAFGRKKPIGDAQEVDNQSSLWDELQKYTSLRTVDAKLEMQRCHEIYRHFASRLGQVIYQSSGGKLSELRWRAPVDVQVHNPLHQILPPFRQLQSLEVHTYNWDRTLRASLQLGDIVLRNPGLRFLRITHYCPYTICTLEEVFPPEIEELSLEVLMITGDFPNANTDNSVPPRNLPRLRNLKTLTIQFGYPSPEPLVNLDLLWCTLKESGACLIELTLEYGISDALMGYLTSYTGLERLELRCQASAQTSHVHDSIATVLLQHAASFASLTISFPFGVVPSRNLPADFTTWPNPSAFQRLECLHVIMAAPFTTDDFQRLLDYSMAVPNLKRLESDWSLTDWNIDDFAEDVKVVGRTILVRRLKLIYLSITVKIAAFDSLFRVLAGWKIAPTSAQEQGEETFLKTFDPNPYCEVAPIFKLE